MTLLQTIKKKTPILGTLVLTGLILTGCDQVPNKTITGKFGENEVTVTESKSGRKVSIRFSGFMGFDRFVSGVDKEGNGQYSEFMLDGYGLEYWLEICNEHSREKLLPYASSDSLDAAYKSVLEQSQNK